MARALIGTKADSITAFDDLTIRGAPARATPPKP